MNQIIVLPEKLSNSRAKKLYEEFKYAWDKTSSKGVINKKLMLQ